MGIAYPFRGGISLYTTLLCKALQGKHNVRLFTLKRQYPKLFFPGKDQLDNSKTVCAVPNDPCIDSINPVSWFLTFKKIRKFNPDFILFSFWHPFFTPSYFTVAYLAKRVTNIAICYLCHNVLPHEQSLVDYLLVRCLFSTGDAFITHSQQDYNKVIKLCPQAKIYKSPHPTYQIFTTYNKIAEDDAKCKLGIAGKRVLLFFGFIRKYKGLKYLLDAMKLLESGQGYHLLLVGEFYDSKSQYQKSIDSLVKMKQLTIVDRYVPNEDVPLYFSAADLVVTPYVSASQSGVVQIAYGFLKPVIATTVGGLPDVVIDGQTGYLVPPCDASAIARATRRFFDQNEGKKFKQNLLLERKKFSWNKMVMIIEEMGTYINQSVK